jgi:hypothetical protein
MSVTCMRECLDAARQPCPIQHSAFSSCRGRIRTHIHALYHGMMPISSIKTHSRIILMTFLIYLILFPTTIGIRRQEWQPVRGHVPGQIISTRFWVASDLAVNLHDRRLTMFAVSKALSQDWICRQNASVARIRTMIRLRLIRQTRISLGLRISQGWSRKSCRFKARRSDAACQKS